MKILKLFFLISFLCLVACGKSGLSDSSGVTESDTDESPSASVALVESSAVKTSNSEAAGTGIDSSNPPAEKKPVLLPIDLTQLSARSLFYSDNCPGGVQGSGYDYSFSDTTISRLGTDFWDNTCNAGIPETEVYIVSNLADESGVPFNCASFPVCSSDDFNKTIVFSDGSQYTLTYDASINTLSAIKLNFLAGTVTTETIVLSYL